MKTIILIVAGLIGLAMFLYPLVKGKCGVE